MHLSELEIKEIFRLLRKRPLMMLTGNPEILDTYVVYFQGFGFAMQVFNGFNFEQHIAKWYHNKVGVKASNMSWSSHFKLVHKEKSEKEKIKLFLNNIEDYILNEIEHNSIK